MLASFHALSEHILFLSQLGLCSVLRTHWVGRLMGKLMSSACVRPSSLQPSPSPMSRGGAGWWQRKRLVPFLCLHSSFFCHIPVFVILSSSVFIFYSYLSMMSFTVLYSASILLTSLIEFLCCHAFTIQFTHSCFNVNFHVFIH